MAMASFQQMEIYWFKPADNLWPITQGNRYPFPASRELLPFHICVQGGEKIIKRIANGRVQAEVLLPSFFFFLLTKE